MWQYVICVAPNLAKKFTTATLGPGRYNFGPRRPQGPFGRPLTHLGVLGETLDAPKKTILCKNHEKPMIKWTILQDTCKNTWVLTTCGVLPIKK